MKNKIAIIVILIVTILFGYSTDLSAESNTVSEIIFIKDDDMKAESLFYQDIVKLGYSVDVIDPDSVTFEKLQLYSLVVLSTGNYPFACQNTDLRLSVQNYITKISGKVIIEGGNTGYIADVFPGYLGFKTKVIKIDSWVDNNGGALDLADSHTFSNLALEPNILPATLNINYESIFNQDVCINNEFSELFYGASLFPGKVGILVAPNVNNPQVINYFVTYSSFADNSEAIKLLENSIYNLIGKPVSVINISENVPDSYFLYQNYPNPFNPSTKIKFDVVPSNKNNSSFVNISVYNTSGKLISRIVNGNFSAGTYEANFDAGNLSGGVYFYKLTVDGKAGSDYQTRKMIILK